MDTCRGNIDDDSLKNRLGAITPELGAAEADYKHLGQVAQLYTIAGTNGVAGQVTTVEMTWLYTTKLSRKGQPGRIHYDSLRGSAPRGICPLCAQRVVSTLDHYLPKASHPAFAITPANLVPACADCNKSKLKHTATTAEEQTFHPYFDDGDDGLWLYGRVVEDTPPAVLFYAQPPAEWAAVKQARIQKHFEVLGLGTLYGANAAEELSQISYVLNRIGDSAGPEAVRQHLAEQAFSRGQAARNLWQAAFYNALAASHWFCNEGHKLIR